MVYFPQYRFEIYRKNSSGDINPVPEVITGFTDMSYAGGIETTKDVLNVKFSNYRLSNGSWAKTLGKSTRADNFVGVDDEIKFYAYYGSALPVRIDDALLIAGRISAFDYKPEGEGNTYTVKIINRTEELLNTMVPYSSRANSGSANTSPTAIKQMVQRLNKFNPSKNLFATFTTEYNPVTGSYGGIVPYKIVFSGSNNGGPWFDAIVDDSKDFSSMSGSFGSYIVSIPSLGIYTTPVSLLGSTIINFSVGSNVPAGALYEIAVPFPTIDYNETWKPVYYNIEKLSSPEYTGDDNAGEYIFYITYTPVLPQYYGTYGSVINEFVWKPKSIVNMGNLVDGSNIHNLNVNLDVREVQNLLIVNAGTDRKGFGITTVAYNTESMGKYGVKTGYYTASRRVFSTIHKAENDYVINTLGKSMDSDGLPVSAGFPITMQFQDRNEDGAFNGSSLIATSKNEWNQYLRDEAKWQAKLQATKVLEKLGEPRYAASGDLVVGSNNIIAGDIYTFVSNSYGWEGNTDNPGYKLRVIDIQHSLNDTGWTSRIEAKEDEKVVSDRLGNSKRSVDNG